MAVQDHAGTQTKRWTVGDVTITRILEHEAQFDMGSMFPTSTPEALDALSWLRPDFIAPDGQGILSMHALVVETPTARIIVDTCIGNDKNRAPFEAATNMQTDFLTDLEAAGFARDSFDIVVCTHLHFDHVGWNTMLVDGRWVPTFPKARYLVGRRDYEQWTVDSTMPPASEFDQVQRLAFADSMVPVLEAGLVDLVEDDHRICPEVSLVPTPGHTVGHVSVDIQSRGARAIITGDMAHHPCQLAYPDWGMPLDIDDAQASATRRRIFGDAADGGVLVVGTHWAGRTAGLVTRSGEGFRLED